MNHNLKNYSPIKNLKAFTFIILLLAFWSQISWASTFEDNSIKIEGEVLMAVYPKEPLAKNLGVCILILSQAEKTSVVIEDATQCFYTRKFRHALGQKVALEESIEFFPQNEEVISSVRGRMSDWPGEGTMLKSLITKDELDFLPDSLKFYHLELE